jgi:hypothetical protein
MTRVIGWMLESLVIVSLGAANLYRAWRDGAK